MSEPKKKVDGSQIPEHVRQTVGELVLAQQKAESELSGHTKRIAGDLNVAQQKLKEAYANISPSLSYIEKIKLPSFSIPRLPDDDVIPAVTPPHVIQEENAWERHADLIKTQTDILSVQTEILQEQKSSSAASRRTFLVAVLTLIVSALGVLFTLVLGLWAT